MRHAIAAMAEQGNNLIVDDVLLAQEKVEYKEFSLPSTCSSSASTPHWMFLKPGSAGVEID